MRVRWAREDAAGQATPHRHNGQQRRLQLLGKQVGQRVQAAGAGFTQVPGVHLLVVVVVAIVFAVFALLRAAAHELRRGAESEFDGRLGEVSAGAPANGGRRA